MLTFSRSRWCLGILGVAFNAQVALAKDNLVWVEYPESGVVLGQGYNLLEDRPASGTCVNFVPIQDPSQSIQYKFDEVTSNTQVQSTTNISASGSMRMAILKASARLSFLSDETFKLETQKFLLSATVVNSSLFAAPSVDFKRGGAVVRQPVGATGVAQDYSSSTEVEMKSEEDLLNVEKCGQGFVSAIVSGASLDAFLTMAKADATSLARIKGSLEADIGGIFTVSGDFEQKQTAASIQQNTTVSVYKTGGSSSRIAYDLAGLKASVAAMPLEAATAPKPIRIAILPYEYLGKFPRKRTYTARLYSDAIAAFFLSKDVFQRSSNVIDLYENISELPSRGQPFYIRDIDNYLKLNARALLNTNRLSTALEKCQDEVAQGNNVLGADGADPERISAASEILSTLGEPSTEGRARPQRDLRTVATVRPELSRTFSDLSRRLSQRAAVASPTVAAGDVSNLALCRPDGEDSFFTLAVEEAISLAAEEISIRPIFWNEIGLNYQQRLEPFIAKVGSDESVANMTDEVRLVLEDYSRLYRSSRLVRDICNRAFSHPLCSIDYLSFVDHAKIVVSQGDVKFTQIAFDAQ